MASAVTAAILILDEQTLLAMRTWLAGDLAGLNWSTLQTALVPALIGLGVALLIAPRLNVLALGDKVALGLGVNLVQTRLLGCWRLRCSAARRWRWPGRSASSGWWCRTWCAVW
ncbi:iron compound permease protein of ABC transporter family [Klebsiella pneumoniae]|nr:iron compound permease protein of ABC transporter family [Klebsiella pneumoniae]